MSTANRTAENEDLNMTDILHSSPHQVETVELYRASEILINCDSGQETTQLCY